MTHTYLTESFCNACKKWQDKSNIFCVYCHHKVRHTPRSKDAIKKFSTENMFHDKCTICMKKSNLKKTLIPGKGNKYQSYCDDCFSKSNYCCQNCGNIYGRYKPDLRSLKGRYLWSMYGTETPSPDDCCTTLPLLRNLISNTRGK